MNNETFKQKMAALERELDAHIARLTPESQQEYKQKQTEFNQDENDSMARVSLKPIQEKLPKRTWTQSL